MGFIWWALPPLLTERGIALATVAQLSATLTLPWVFKFVIGPIVDYIAMRGLAIRHFIVLCQLVMGLCLLAVIPLDWSENFDLLLIALFVHGCFAASQDVAIDALAIRTVPAHELGNINGWMQTGMLGGRALAAASVVALISVGNQGAGVWFVIVLIWLPMLAVLWARPDERGAATIEPADKGIHWRSFVTPAMLVGLWIALTAGAGFEFFTVTVGPLMQSLEFAAADLATLFGAVAPAGLAAGALAGGFVASRSNARRATFIGIVAVTAAIALLAGLILAGLNLPRTGWLLPLIPVYLGTGFLTAASYTLLMQLSRGEYSATRFAIFMSATNGCEVWVTYLGSRLTANFGQVITLLLLLPIAFLAAPGLLWLSRRNTA